MRVWQKLSILAVMLVLGLALGTAIADTWWDSGYDQRATVTVSPSAAIGQHHALVSINGSRLAGEVATWPDPAEDSFRVMGPLWLEGFDHGTGGFRTLNGSVSREEQDNDHHLSVSDGAAISHPGYPLQPGRNYSFSALVSGTGTAAPVPAAVDDMIGNWHFEQTEDTVKGYDPAGKGLTLGNGSVFTEPSYADGVIGNGLLFEDDLVTGNISSLIDTHRFTISFWVRPRNVSGFDHPIGIGDGEEATVYLSDSGPEIDYKFDGVFDGGRYEAALGAYTLDQWHHVVVTYNGTSLRGYLDGSLGASHAVDGSFNVSDGDIVFGAAATEAAMMNGTIDEVLVMERALNDTVALDLYGMYDSSVSNQGAGFTTGPNGFRAPLSNVSIVLGSNSSGTFDDISLRPDDREVPSHVDDWTSAENNRTPDDPDAVFDIDDELSWEIEESFPGSELQYRIYWNDSATDPGYVSTRGSEWGVRDVHADGSWVYDGNGGTRYSYAALWRLDTGSGSTVKDTSDNSNAGTRVDADPGNADGDTPPAWTDGLYGEALSFDGRDDLVNVSDGDSLDLTANFTIDVWFRSDREINATNNVSALVSKEDAYGLWWQQEDGGRLRFGTFGGNIRSVKDTWEAGRWYHVAAVHDGDTSRIYVDGELDREASNTDAVTAETTPLRIGSDRVEDVFFDGRIDGVRLYNRSLSREEVRYQWLQGEDITYLNTSELLVEYRNRDLGRTETPGLSVRVNGLQNTSFGNGWTEPSQLGTGLGAARVHAYVASEHGHVYDVYFDLMSGADFLEMEVR